METVLGEQEVADVEMSQTVLGVKGQCLLIVSHGIWQVPKETVDHAPVGERIWGG